MYVCACLCVCENECVIEWLSSYALRLITPGMSNRALTENFLPSTSSSYTSPHSCDRDLEFPGVQIQWPWLVNQLGVQVGLWVPTPIS